VVAAKPCWEYRTEAIAPAIAAAALAPRRLAISERMYETLSPRRKKPQTARVITKNCRYPVQVNSCSSGATPIYGFAVLRQLDHHLPKFRLRMFRPASTQPTKSEGVEDRLKFSGARILLGHHAMTGEMRFWEQEAAHQDSEMISHARFDRRPSPIRSRPTHATDTSFPDDSRNAYSIVRNPLLAAPNLKLLRSMLRY
jgi:hypothetical protein